MPSPNLQQKYPEVLARMTSEVQEDRFWRQGRWYRAVVGPPGYIAALPTPVVGAWGVVITAGIRKPLRQETSSRQRSQNPISSFGYAHFGQHMDVVPQRLIDFGQAIVFRNRLDDAMPSFLV